MKTLADLVRDSENNEYEDNLLIKYSDSTKDLRISPRAVMGDPSLEKLLHLKAHSIGGFFKVLADEQPLRFIDLLGDPKNDTFKIRVKLIIYESGKSNEFRENATLLLKDVERYMELEIIVKNDEYILDVDLQASVQE